MHGQENIALFDRYISGGMEQVERDAFEERLNHSVSFKADFDAYITFSKEIEEGAEYEVIHNELSTIHTDLFGKKKTKILPLKILIPIGIAASIALLVIFNPFGIGSQKNMATNSYEPLANMEENASESMEDQISSDVDYIQMDSNDNNYFSDYSQPIDNQPLGTAFLIGENGYFLTSKHLVEEESVVLLQQKDLDITFRANVVYCDSILDLAILQCSEEISTVFERIPYQLVENPSELGDDLFTLGYSKKEIVYTKGTVSSETGYLSDSLYLEASLPSNAGHSGAPIFNDRGDLIGIITARNADKQSVTYVLKYNYIEGCLATIKDSVFVDMSNNYRMSRSTKRKKLIKVYRGFVFEVH